jgi:hypothetical protein
MSVQTNDKAARFASVLYGTVAFLSALLAVSPEQFTVFNVISGGIIIGVATMLTYYFKEIVHQEADLGVLLQPSGYLEALVSSLSVLVFPGSAIFIAIVGLTLGISANTMLTSIFYLGIITVGASAFGSTYGITKDFLSASLRATIWIALCILLLVAKKLA